MDDKETRAYIEKLEFENQAIREDMDATIKNAKIFQAECRALEKDNERLGRERDEAIAERDKFVAELAESKETELDAIEDRREEFENYEARIDELTHKLGQVHAARNRADDTANELEKDLARVKDANVKLIEERDELRGAIDSEKKNVCARCAGLAPVVPEPGIQLFQINSILARLNIIETWIKRVSDAGKIPVVP